MYISPKIFESIFVILTSWAPIWVYFFGMSAYPINYDSVYIVSRPRLIVRILKLLKYFKLLILYLVTYILLIVYAINQNETLLHWALGLYIFITLYTLFKVWDRPYIPGRRSRFDFNHYDIPDSDSDSDDEFQTARNFDF